LILGPFGYRLKERSNFFIGFLHLNELIGNFSDENKETLCNTVLCSILEGVETTSVSSRAKILAGFKDFLDKRGLIQKVIHNGIQIFIESQDKNVADFLMQYVMIWMILKVK
jgi:hypothetical protein